MGVPFTNSGGVLQVDANVGTLKFTKSSTYAGGTFTVASGGVLDFSTATHSFSGSFSDAIAGSLQLSSGTLEAASGGATFGFSGNGFDWKGGSISCVGTLTNTQLLTISGSNSQYLSGTLSNQGTMVLTGLYFSFAGGTLSNSGTFDIQVDKALSHSSGTNSVVNTGTFKKSSGSGTSQVGVPFDNVGSGTVEVETGTLYLSGGFADFAGSTLSGGTYQVVGTLKFTGANIVTNAADITLDGASSQIVNQSAVNALAGLASNASGGSLALQNGRGLSTAGAFGNAGDLTVATGCTFTATGAYTQTGGSTTLANGTLAASGTVDIQSGTLGGNGTVSATVSNGGQVSPGSSAGTLNITGDYAQAPGGTLNIEIGGITAGTEHDVLNVTGAATIDGTLDLELIGGFTPTQPETFEILNYASHSGSFASTTGSAQTLEVDYQGTMISLSVPDAVEESSPAAGLSGEVTVGPGGEVPLFVIGVSGNTGTAVNSVTLTLSDLSSPSGIAGSDLYQLVLYRSADGILDGGDTQIGTQGTVQIGSATTLSADAPDVLTSGTELFYIVAAQMNSTARDGKAFRVGFEANGVSTSLGGRGSAVTASDANRVRVEVVATQLVFTTQPGGAESGSALMTQPVVEAQDAGGNVDVDFSEVVTLTATATVGGGTLLGDVDVAAVSGVATFVTVQYDVASPGDTFVLRANDEDGVGGDLPWVDSLPVVGGWREFIVPLSAGFNLISLGESSANDSIATLVEPIAGNLIRVVGFETSLINPNPPYLGGKLYNPSLPGYINTLKLTDVRLAYWLVMSAADTLITGGVPAKVVAQGVTAENGLHPVYDFMGIHGHLRLDGVPAPVGTVVEVVDGQGTLAGRSEVHHAGYYGYLPIYRDDVGSAVDEGAETGEWLRLRVNGQPTGALVQWTEFGDEVQLDVEVVTAGSSPLPTESALGPNYPNPFNPSTTISYELGSEREIVLSIWNLAGQRIRELVRATQAAGPHFVVWDGHSDSGMPVGNGVYLYELRSGDFRSVRKMVLVK